MNIGYDAKRIFHNQTGLGSYGRNLILALTEHHPEHCYFLYNPKPSTSKLFVPNGSHIFERHPRSFLQRKFHSLWRQRGISKDLKKDNIHLFHGLSGEIPLSLKAHGIKSIVTIHDLIFMRYPRLYKTIDRSIYRSKFSYACSHADKIIAISKQTKADIVEFMGINPEKIQVIYQSCHPAFKQLHPIEEKRAVLYKYGLPDEFILSVGTIEERKNVLSVVKAIRHIDIHLVVAGRGTSYAKEVKAYIRQHGLSNKVTFIHNASTYELAKLYQSALIFIYPSLFEGFGIPIIEALYAGTPVITTTGGCFREAGGEHSWYVSPKNVEEISHAIQQLMDDPDKRDLMRVNGLIHTKQFDDSHIADTMMAAYADVVNS